MEKLISKIKDDLIFFLNEHAEICGEDNLNYLEEIRNLLAKTPEDKKTEVLLLLIKSKYNEIEEKLNRIIN